MSQNSWTIGVISDTHIADKSVDLPPKIIQAFKNVDMILHAGDITDLSVIEKLKILCKDVRVVAGNMDSPEVKARLPEKEIIHLGRHKIGLAHGYGSPQELISIMGKIFRDDSVDIIVFGHSHMPVNETRGNTLFFNPGSATDKVFSLYNSYGILKVNGKIEAKIIKL